MKMPKPNKKRTEEAKQQIFNFSILKRSPSNSFSVLSPQPALRSSVRSFVAGAAVATDRPPQQQQQSR